jgi:hypothetical protein
MPRAALLSIHARVEGANPASWEDPSLVQVWGPRFSAYVVAARDAGAFTLGRQPDGPDRRRGEDAADRLEALLEGARMRYGEAGRRLGVNPNALRYSAPTGRVLIRWDGARQPDIWVVPRPAMDPVEARLELARRHLHVFGPTDEAAFASWAGIRPPRARRTYEALRPELTQVRTPIGDRWILTSDESASRQPPGPAAKARLLPSGDAFYLLQGRDRELLVPDAARRPELWTSRVWPGAVLVDGEVAGIWRRAGAVVTINAWRPLVPAAREAVIAEAQGMPLPDIAGRIVVRWEG